jgi:hydrogenase expression/formation protein HypE
MKDNRVVLAHGSGGLIARRLIEERLVPALGDRGPVSLDDGAFVDELPDGRIVLTTDGHVVDPLVFPGGDIGRLSVCGTVNDLAVMGAVPIALTLGLVIEEGLPVDELVGYLDSMRTSAIEADVGLVAGDTKVVPRGAADGLFITTSGLGVVPDGVSVSGSNARVGDAVLVSGPVGDHEMCITALRSEIALDVPLESDVAPILGMVSALLDAVPDVHAMRDPTRGGTATAVCEIARASGVGVELHEEAIPIRPSVAAACEVLGFDPLYLACEGRCLVFVPEEHSEIALSVLRSHPLGAESAIIGRCREYKPGRVVLKTAVGGGRVLDLLSGEQLPRIC